MRMYIFYQREEKEMNKWIKSFTAVALASSLFVVGCSKNEDKKDETTQQEGKTTEKETSGEGKDKNSKDSSSSSTEKK